MTTQIDSNGRGRAPHGDSDMNSELLNTSSNQIMIEGATISINDRPGESSTRLQSVVKSKSISKLGKYEWFSYNMELNEDSKQIILYSDPPNIISLQDIISVDKWSESTNTRFDILLSSGTLYTFITETPEICNQWVNRLSSYIHLQSDISMTNPDHLLTTANNMASLFNINSGNPNKSFIPYVNEIPSPNFNNQNMKSGSDAVRMSAFVLGDTKNNSLNTERERHPDKYKPRQTKLSKESRGSNSNDIKAIEYHYEQQFAQLKAGFHKIRDDMSREISQLKLENQALRKQEKQMNEDPKNRNNSLNNSMNNSTNNSVLLQIQQDIAFIKNELVALKSQRLPNNINTGNENSNKMVNNAMNFHQNQQPLTIVSNPTRMNQMSNKVSNKPTRIRSTSQPKKSFHSFG